MSSNRWPNLYFTNSSGGSSYPGYATYHTFHGKQIDLNDITIKTQIVDYIHQKYCPKYPLMLDSFTHDGFTSRLMAIFLELHTNTQVAYSITDDELEDLFAEVTKPEIDISSLELFDTPKCKHKNKYLNVCSKNLKFWYCPDCKEEVK